MTWGRKTGGRDIKPGEVRNPNGRPRLPEELKKARKLTADKFEMAVNRFLFGTKEEIAEASRNPETKVIDLLIASILHKAIVGGDEKRLQFVLDRLIGKVKDEQVQEINVTADRLKELMSKIIEDK